MSKSKLWMLSVFIILIAVGCYTLSSIVWQFALCAILAYLLTPFVDFAENKLRFRRGLAVFSVIVLIILITVIFMIFAIPALVNQIMLLIKDMPGYTEQIMSWLEELQYYMKDLEIPSFVVDGFMATLNQASGTIPAVLRGTVDALIAVPGKLMEMLVGLIIQIYFLMDGKRIVTGFINLFSVSNKVIVKRILNNINELIRDYIKTNIILAIGVSVLTYIGLSLFGVPYALLVAVLTFILDFVPYFGSLIASCIAILVAFFTIGWPLVIYVALYMLVVEQLEASVFGPMLQSNSLGIHPLWILFALLSCGALWGPIGMFIAVPMAGIIKIVFHEMHEKFIQ